MDLNLLRVFVAVYEARSLTAAAQALFVSQPAVSQSLARLRRELVDDLFFRDGREMVPTPFAEELYPTIHASLEEIEAAVSTRAFDPAHSRRRFRIALSELGELNWAAPIAQAVWREGKHIGIDVHALEPAAMAEQLSKGAIDLAINSAPLGTNFASHTLRIERYAVLHAVTHPLAREKLDLKAYREADHVFVEGDSGKPNITNALDALGVSIIPRMRINRYAALPDVLRSNDFIATVPRSLADVWTQTPEFSLRDLPFYVAPVEVKLYTRSAFADAPALHWFRDTVLNTVSEV